MLNLCLCMHLCAGLLLEGLQCSPFMIPLTVLASFLESPMPDPDLSPLPSGSQEGDRLRAADTCASKSKEGAGAPTERSPLPSGSQGGDRLRAADTCASKGKEGASAPAESTSAAPSSALTCHSEAKYRTWVNTQVRPLTTSL